jgi:GT2 family glycosyltransferase
MIDISVIIVNWNTKQFVLDCIQSLFTYKGDYELEIIVVDNASKDDSVSAFKANFPDVIVLENKQNLGFAKANNQGIRIAQSRYVCLVNSDILFLEDSLRPMLNYMDNHPEVGMLGPKLLWQDQTLQGSCRKFPSLWNTLCPAIGLTNLFPHASFFSGEHMVGYFKHDQIKDADVLVGAFLMVRQLALKQVGDMDDKYFMYCEEVDWCKRFIIAGWKIRFFPETKVIHYGGGSSASEPVRFFREYCLSNLRYWNKHYTKLSVAVYRTLMIIRYLIRLPFLAAIYWIRRSDAWKTKLGIVVTGLQVFTNISKTKFLDAQHSTLK